MGNNLYKDYAKFRVRTCESIMERSKRSSDKIYKDIDKEMLRIANSIQRGYTLGSIRHDVEKGEYRPYRYFDITFTDIHNPLNLSVTIERNGYAITITEDSLSEFVVWCTKWKVKKPETIDQCLDDSFYSRWW